jgi:hypothetical protein
MTTLRVKQIQTKLRELFEPHLDLSDVSLADKERDSKVLTRCLAAFAVYNQTGCGEEQAGAAVWDGSDDNGIDAAFYDASDNRVVIVQSKWIYAGAGEPEAKDVSTFANGVKDLVEQETGNFGARLQQKLFEISQAIMTPGTTVHVVLISTGASELAKHGVAALERVINELNGADQDEPLATYEVVGLAQIYPALASSASQDRISIDATILDWSFVPQPYAAYFGVVDGLQLKGWWGTYGKRLVAKNIRHALGVTEVNNQIRVTAAGAPEIFGTSTTVSL